MIPAQLPKNEQDRLAAVLSLHILDTPSEERFNRITRIATSLFHVPISTITLIDSKREWHKSCQGLSALEGDRAISFCGHTIQSDSPLIVRDARLDVRFADNPMVIGEPYIRFYAGVPLQGPNGHHIGAICIKDHVPREFTPEEQKQLVDLASWTELELNAHELSSALADRRMFSQKLEQEKEYIEHIISAAPNLIVALGPDGTTLQVNPAVVAATGYTESEIVGKNWWELFYPGDLHVQVDKLFADFERGQVVNYEMTLKIKSGQTKTISWNSVNRYKPDGTLAEVIGVGVDTSAYKQKEQELNEKISELERLNRLMVDRELKMIELKNEIKQLKERQ